MKKLTKYLYKNKYQSFCLNIIQNDLLFKTRYFNSYKKYHEPHPTKSVYKRQLPKDYILLSSHQGKKLLKESIEDGYAQSFPTLIQQFITQSQPSTCGLATLAIVLNALKIDPKQNWKGIWRWYDDYNIKGTTDQQIMKGVSIKEWHELALKNSLKSMYFHPNAINQGLKLNNNVNFLSDQNIIECIKCCTRRQNFPMSINVSRPALQQTGSGHFSPIAAYHQKEQKVLFLDTAKFKYPLYWTPLQKVIQSLKPLDNQTKLPRGIILNKKSDDYDIESVFCNWQPDHFINQKLLKQISILQLKKSIVLSNIQYDYETFNVTQMQHIQIYFGKKDIDFVFNEQTRHLLIPFLFDLLNDQNQSQTKLKKLVEQIKQQILYKKYLKKFYLKSVHEKQQEVKTQSLIFQFCNKKVDQSIIYFLLSCALQKKFNEKQIKGRMIQKYIKKLKCYFFDFPIKNK